MATPSDSMLLLMPKELRLLIYDELFESFTQRPKHFSTYVLPSEWPKNDFSSYISLQLTCQQLHAEVTTHFEGQYLPKTIVYFDNVPELKTFCGKIAKHPESSKYDVLQICLHDIGYLCSTITTAHSDLLTTAGKQRAADVLEARRDVNWSIRNFAVEQPACDFKTTPVIFAHCGNSSTMCMHYEYERPGMSPINLVRHEVRQGKRLHIDRFPLLEGTPTSTILESHMVCGNHQTGYMCMMMAVKDVAWRQWTEGRYQKAGKELRKWQGLRRSSGYEGLVDWQKAERKAFAGCKQLPQDAS